MTFLSDLSPPQSSKKQIPLNTSCLLCQLCCHPFPSNHVWWDSGRVCRSPALPATITILAC